MSNQTANQEQTAEPKEKQVKLPANLSMKNVKEFCADNSKAKAFFQEVAEAGGFGDPNRFPALRENGCDLKGLKAAAEDKTNSQQEVAKQALEAVQQAFQRVAKK
jgi:hypothetical protein